MRRPLLLLSVLLLASCVTINVYFPAAEVRQAAEEFVEGVIGEPAGTAAPERPPGAALGLPDASTLPDRILLGRTLRFEPLGFFIGTAHAQQRIDIDVRTPAIQAIRERMAERFQTTLAPLFDSGALGFGNDGFVVLRDPARVPLAQRTAVNQAVADENRDRRAVYREIAVTNGHPEWEEQIRLTFAREWAAQARSGWWYQDSAGVWKQK